MGRFDTITAPTLPGVGRFDTVGATQNRFSNTSATTPKNDVSIGSVAGGALNVFGGLVGAAGRLLTTTQAATTGLIEKGLEKVGVLKPRADTGIIPAIQKQESNIDLLRRVGQETGKGGVFTGQYTPSQSVFGNFIHEIPVATEGVLADIFLDPLTYVGGFGLVKRATTAVGGLVKEGATTLAHEIPAVQKMGDILGRAFVTRYGQSEAFKTLDIQRKIGESLAKENVSKLVSPVIERPAIIQQRVTQALKGAGVTDNEVKILADPIREELDRVGESISKLNPKLLSEETFQANKGTYFPRLYTDYEFAKDEEIIGQTFSPRAVSIPKEPFKARLLTEEQSLAKGTRIEEAGYPALKRLTQLNVVEQRQKFFSETAKLASDEPKPGYLQLSEDKSLGDLAGKFLPAAEYKAIADIRHIPSTIEEIYNRALSTWKTFKTAYNPATIARNDLTNFFVLNPLGGVGPHRLDVYARTASELMSKGPLYQLARQHGLEISTQQAAELTSKASRFYRENKGVVSQFFGKVGDFNNMVKNFYGSQDKFFKLANFIKGVTSDGLTPEKAIQRANFHLIDYSEAPELVNWLRKSPVGIPFISFTYGVSKPLAKTLLEHPEKLANYFKILRGVQLMNPLGETPAERAKEQGVLPDWISEGTFLRLPVKDTYGRSQYVDLQYILPFNILETNSILPSNPLLNILAGQLTNKDVFTGRDLTLKSDTPTEAMQKRVTNVLGQLLPSLTPLIGTSFNKIKNALEQRPDRNGFVKSKLEAFVDVLGGIKITPIDPTVEAQKRASERAKEIEELRSQLKTLMLDKSIFPEEKATRAEDIRQKLHDVGNNQPQATEGNSLPPTEQKSPNQSPSSDSTTDPITSLVEAVKSAFVPKIAQAAGKETPVVRGVSLNSPDLDTLRAVLFAEISNRTSDKQKLEARTIINTVINRAKKSGKTVQQELIKPNQYQGYDSKQYQRLVQKKTTVTDNQKIAAVDAVLKELLSGNFKDNIEGRTFYHHNPDGSIVATNKYPYKR